MSAVVKNRLLIYFDREKTLLLKIKFNTLEQAIVFIFYLQKCAAAPYIYVSREVLTDDGWSVADTREYINDGAYAAKRASKSPFKLEAQIMATEAHGEFWVKFYTFEGVDLDHINVLLERGVSAKEVRIAGYRRDRETKEWLSRDFSKFVPANVAELFFRLTTQDRADAIEYMQKLESMR